MSHNSSRREFIKTSAAALAGTLAGIPGGCMMATTNPVTADLILTNARIASLDQRNPHAEAVAIKDGKFLAVGGTDILQRHRGSNTVVIDANRRTIIPGLNDSHLHVIRGGLNYN